MGQYINNLVTRLLTEDNNMPNSYTEKGIAADGVYPFDFGGRKAVKSSVSVKKTGYTAEGGNVGSLTYTGETTESDGTVTVESVNYQVSVTTLKYFTTSVGTYYITVPSTIDVTITWTDYIAAPPPAVSSPSGTVPETMSNSEEPMTEEEWTESKVFWGGFNIPYKDDYHDKILGNGVIQSPQAFQSPHIKDTSQAEEIARFRIFNSQKYPIDITTYPYLFKLGEFAQIIDTYNNIDSVERIEKIRKNYNEQTTELSLNTTIRE